MMKSTLHIINLLLLCCPWIVYGQDPQFSQFFAHKTYLNPAYVGSNKCPDFTIGYRNQAPELNGNFITKTISYDQYAPSLNGGFGLSIVQDQQGEGNLTSTFYSLMYAYPLNFRNGSFRAGFKVSYFQNRVQWDQLKFADMFDSDNRSTAPQSQEFNNTENYGAGADISAGGLYNYKNIYAGITINHLTQPPQYIFGYESRLKRSYIIHGGGIWNIKSGLGDIQVSPNFLIAKQGNFHQINSGIYVKKSDVIMGIWYRHKDAVVILLGIDQNRYKIGYSYDHNIGAIGQTISSGSHELSFTYKLKCKKKIRKYQVAVCPQF